MCGSCGLLDDEDFQDVPATYQTVDVYAKFIDLFYNGQAKIKETKIGVEEREETS
jgi:transcription elongation factor Elf1